MQQLSESFGNPMMVAVRLLRCNWLLIGTHQSKLSHQMFTYDYNNGEFGTLV